MAWSVAVVAAGNVLGMVSVVNRYLTLLIYGVKVLTAESIKCIILRIAHGYLRRRAA